MQFNLNLSLQKRHSFIKPCHVLFIHLFWCLTASYQHRSPGKIYHKENTKKSYLKFNTKCWQQYPPCLGCVTYRCFVFNKQTNISSLCLGNSSPYAQRQIPLMLFVAVRFQTVCVILDRGCIPAKLSSLQLWHNVHTRCQCWKYNTTKYELGSCKKGYSYIINTDFIVD